MIRPLLLLPLLLAGLAATTTGRAETLQVPPFKDDLFGYRRILSTDHGGDFVRVEFDKARDIDARDAEPLKRAHDRYVSLDVNDTKRDLAIGPRNRPVPFLAVGRTGGGARLIVVFLHGAHGDRRLAMEDHRFGGNFNRLKNLVARAGGVYLTPQLTDFARSDTADVAEIIRVYREASPGAPVVVGCASTGCKVVFRLLAGAKTAPLVDGVVLLGALATRQPGEGTLLSADALARRAPPVAVYLGHGSADTVVPWEAQEAFFKAVKAKAPDYPIRFELFSSGDAVHGTPLRMVDWRSVLNWILSRS